MHGQPRMVVPRRRRLRRNRTRWTRSAAASATRKSSSSGASRRESSKAPRQGVSRSSRSDVGVWVSMVACAPRSPALFRAGHAPARLRPHRRLPSRSATGARAGRRSVPSTVIRDDRHRRRQAQSDRRPLDGAQRPTIDIRRFSFTNVTVADGTVVSPRELLIDGKAAGTISLIVWGDTRRVQYELVVEPSITTLEQRLHELFPGEDINVSVSRRRRHPLGPRLDERRDAARRGNRRHKPAQPARHQHAAAAGRHAEPAGDAAGALRRSEPHGRREPGRRTSFATRTNFTASSTTQQFPPPTFDRDRRAAPAASRSATS